MTATQGKTAGSGGKRTVHRSGSSNGTPGERADDVITITRADLRNLLAEVKAEVLSEVRGTIGQQPAPPPEPERDPEVVKRVKQAAMNTGAIQTLAADGQLHLMVETRPGRVAEAISRWQATKKIASEMLALYEQGENAVQVKPEAALSVLR